MSKKSPFRIDHVTAGYANYTSARRVETTGIKPAIGEVAYTVGCLGCKSEACGTFTVNGNSKVREEVKDHLSVASEITGIPVTIITNGGITDLDVQRPNCDKSGQPCRDPDAVALLGTISLRPGDGASYIDLNLLPQSDRSQHNYQY